MKENQYFCTLTASAPAFHIFMELFFRILSRVVT